MTSPPILDRVVFYCRRNDSKADLYIRQHATRRTREHKSEHTNTACGYENPNCSGTHLFQASSVETIWMSIRSVQTKGDIHKHLTGHSASLHRPEQRDWYTNRFAVCTTRRSHCSPCQHQYQIDSELFVLISIILCELVLNNRNI
jgi:hypothetical protein